MTVPMFAVLSGAELAILAVIFMLVFGSAWLPKMARKAGHNKVQLEKAKAEFDAAKEEFTGPVKEATDMLSKANQTLNAKPSDLVKKLAAPSTGAAAAAAPADDEANIEDAVVIDEPSSD